MLEHQGLHGVGVSNKNNRFAVSSQHNSGTLATLQRCRARIDVSTCYQACEEKKDRAAGHRERELSPEKQAREGRGGNTGVSA